MGKQEVNLSLHCHLTSNRNVILVVGVTFWYSTTVERAVARQMRKLLTF